MGCTAPSDLAFPDAGMIDVVIELKVDFRRSSLSFWLDHFSYSSVVPILWSATNPPLHRHFV